MKLTQEELKKYLNYDKNTGDFTWIKKTNKFSHINVGSKAGFKNHEGYIHIMLKGIDYSAHRLAWFYMEGYWAEYTIDHINRDPSDNRWCNLREASFSCNARNRKIPSNNTSSIVGVRRRESGKWRARIFLNKKHIDLGTYFTFNEAVKARWEAEKEYGFPNCNTSSSAYQYLKENDLI